MYNVFFVEDQAILRESTRTSDIWSKDRFNLCGVAGNGRDAWEQIRQMDIDIVITDIRMPFLDGLELTRLLRRHLPHVRVIILSGYNDFEYARQALSEGVVEYVLKPIRTSDLLGPLEKAVQSIDLERSSRIYIHEMEQKLNTAEVLKRLQLLVDMSLEAKPVSDLRRRAEALGIPVEKNYIAGVVVKSDGTGLYKEMSGPLLAAEMETAISEHLAGRPDVYVFNRNGRDVRLLFVADGARNKQEKLKNKLSEVIADIRALLDKTFHGLHVIICIGRIEKGIEGVARSFSSADMAVSLKFLFDGDLNTLDLNHPMSQQLSSCSADAKPLLSLDRGQIVEEMIVSSSPDNVHAVVRQLVLNVEQETSSREQRMYAIIDILGNVYKFVSSEPRPDNERIMEADVYSFLIENIDNQEKIIDYIAALAIRVVESRKQLSAFPGSDIVEKACAYIDQHYTDPEISLGTVANYVNVSINHLSAVFSRECNETFSRYLMNKRMEKAKELLSQTNRYISEIAFEVGYDDSNYFSKVFKKSTGVTPMEYRLRMRR